MSETSTLISNNGTQFTQVSCLLRHVWPQCQGYFPKIVHDLQSKLMSASPIYLVEIGLHL